MNTFFVEALDLRKHPLKKAKKTIRVKYLASLSYIIKSIKKNIGQNSATQHISKRLNLYYNKLFVEEKYCGRYVLEFSRYYKYLPIIICDIALILLKDEWILQAIEIISHDLSIKQQIVVKQIYSLLQSKGKVEKQYLYTLSLINQYRDNKDFFSKKERRIIVTANMSAGKSTLINAIVGKPVARTSQEACTGNICYLFNKAYEDENIHLSTPQGLNFSATADDLHDYDWDERISIASYFKGLMPDIPRLCIIDTPGVDAALHKEHRNRTHDALLSDNYDTIIYVVSPTRLGTDAEKRHLQWVCKNLQKKKIIFVLNKLDDYHDFSDSIEESIQKFKGDLLEIGFNRPIICPISAYFAYLLKLRITGQDLSDDEEDEYDLYSKKFMRTSYDLSHYYKGVQCLPTDSDEIILSKRAGLYGLEKIIYGG